MYAKCGVLMKARSVLDGLCVRDVICWNTLIIGYAQQEQGEEVLCCFQRMRSKGLCPNAITYACILKACAIMQDVDMGRKVHDEIANQGLLTKNVMLGTALIDMYAKCVVLRKAQNVLDELPVQQGQGKEALACFHQMRSQGLSLDGITYACILKACGIMQDADMGKKVHDEIVSQGLFQKNIVLGTTLVDMYAQCGMITKARNVLNELPIQSVVSWNVLIAGCVQQRQGHEALAGFQQMRSEGLCPNAITYACVLKACGIMQDPEMGKKIHDEIVSQGLLQKDIVLCTALVDMYAKCGVLMKAKNPLDELPVRNVVLWNTLIAGYAEQGQGQEALGCFQRMQTEGFYPDVISLNALIGGYAQQGLVEEAVDCFQWMQQEGTSPDSITFVSMLNACSHSGLVDKGQTYFENMRKKYGITPDKEHYTCMVDLFGRAKLFDKVLRVIKMFGLLF